MTFTLDEVTRDEAGEIASALGFDLSAAQIESIVGSIDIGGYSDLDSFGVDAAEGSHGDRSRQAIDDPHNAFITPLSLSLESGELSGVDIAVKDNIAVAGVPMTCGSRVFESAIPRRDAVVVDRLLSAGARIVGKTNMDELAFGPTGETSQFGPTTNPVDDGHVPGGSSSGSAAAVGSGVADAALGSDTGGSVRIPAAFCGLVGFKPTWGVVSRSGFVELAYTHDTIGVLATDVKTTARVLQPMIGFDPGDPPTGRAARLTAIEPGDSTSLASCSFAMPEEFVGDHVQPGVADRFEDELDRLTTVGATVDSVSIPGMVNAVGMWGAITTIEFASVLRARGTPIHRRTRVDPAWHDAASAAFHTDGAGLGDIIKAKAIEGSLLLDRYGSRYYVRAHEAEAALTSEFTAILAEYDAIVTPTMPMVAPELGDWAGYGSTLPMAYNTRPANITGMPAITVPAGNVDGLPVGIQFIGPAFADADLLRLGQAYETHHDQY